MDTILTDYTCLVCGYVSQSLSACLSHETMFHDLNRADAAKGNLKIIKEMRDVVMMHHREKLHQALCESKPFTELNVINAYYRGDKEKGVEPEVECLRKLLPKEYSVLPYNDTITALKFYYCNIEVYGRRDVNHKAIFDDVADRLVRSDCFRDVVKMSPIIQFKHSVSESIYEMVVYSTKTLESAAFLHELIVWDHRFQEMVDFLLNWGKQLQVVGHGLMSIDCLIALVLFYLQQCNLLPPMLTLQSKRQENYVDEVKYRYHALNEVKRWPIAITATNLIYHFFHFYETFDFKGKFITPYLGKAVPFMEVPTLIDQYRPQLGQIVSDYFVFSLAIQKLDVVRVQDPLSLNTNLASCMTDSSLQHFRGCLQNAVQIFNSEDIFELGVVYEDMLFDKVEQDVWKQIPDEKILMKARKKDNWRNNIKAYKMQTTVHPRSSEVLAILRFLKIESTEDVKSNFILINKYWAEHYVSAVQKFVTELFCINLFTTRPAKSGLQREYAWKMRSGAGVDMWSDRKHTAGKGSVYLESQYAQTEIFKSERFDNPKFAVYFHGALELKLSEKYNEIVMTASTYSGSKAEKMLTSFFSALRHALVHYNIRQVLKVDDLSKD